MRTALQEQAPAAKARALRRSRALTIVELLLVVVVLATLALIFLPPLLVRKPPAYKIMCANNLLQIGLGLRQFANDNNGQFPQALSTNQGGVEELVSIRPGGAGDPARAFWAFVAMSNELATPKVLVCPADKNRAAISNFYGMAYATPLAQGGRNASLSYFVNLDASKQQPQAILSGDRNLSTVTNAKRASDYDAFFSVEHRIRPEDVRRGKPYADLQFQESIHNRQGNAVLADGSVQQMTGAKVREQLLASTNGLRLIFPFVPGKNE